MASPITTQELAVRAVVYDVEDEGTLLIKAHSAGKVYEALDIGNGLELGGDSGTYQLDLHMGTEDWVAKFGDIQLENSIIYSDPTDTYIRIYGLVGVGCTPTYQFQVQDDAFSFTDDVYNVYFNHTKTGGASDFNDDWTGVYNYKGLNQAGGEIGHMILHYDRFDHTDGTIGSAVNAKHLYGHQIFHNLDSGTCYGNVYGPFTYIDQESAHTIGGYTYLSYGIYLGGGTQTGRIYGNYRELRQEAGSTWSNRVYGDYNFVNLDSSTAADLVYGGYILIDQEAAHTASSNVYGQFIDMDLDGTVTGDSWLSFLSANSGIDFGLEISGAITTHQKWTYDSTHFLTLAMSNTGDATWTLGSVSAANQISWMTNHGGYVLFGINQATPVVTFEVIGNTGPLVKFTNATDTGKYLQFTVPNAGSASLYTTLDGIGIYNRTFIGDNSEANYDAAGLEVAETGGDPQLRLTFDEDVDYVNHTVDGDGYYSIVASGGKTTIGSSTAHDGTLHVFTSSAGAVTAASYANELVLESADDTGMSFLAPDNKNIYIEFQSPTYNSNYLVYDLDAKKLMFVRDATDLLWFDEDILNVRVVTSSTGAVSDLLKLVRDDDGNYANGDGIGLTFNMPDDGGALRELFSIDAQWISANQNDAEGIFSLMGNEVFRVLDSTNYGLTIQSTSKMHFPDDTYIMFGTYSGPWWDAHIEHDTATTPDELRIQIDTAGEHLRLKNAGGGSGEIILETDSGVTGGITGIKLVGDDWKGTAWDSAGSGNYRFLLLDENGQLVVSNADVDLSGTAV